MNEVVKLHITVVLYWNSMAVKVATLTNLSNVHRTASGFFYDHLQTRVGAVFRVLGQNFFFEILGFFLKFLSTYLTNP